MIGNTDRITVLTPRESEVARMVADDLTYTAIAKRLGISAATVRRHLDNIGEKLGKDPERTRIALIKRWVERAA